MKEEKTFIQIIEEKLKEWEEEEENYYKKYV